MRAHPNGLSKVLSPPLPQTAEHAERAESAAAEQAASSRAVADLKVETARAAEALKVELSGQIGGQKEQLARAEEAIRVRCADWAGVERLLQASVKVPVYRRGAQEGGSGRKVAPGV